MPSPFASTCPVTPSVWRSNTRSVANESSILVCGDRVAAATSRHVTDDLVVIDVDDIVAESVETPASHIDDDVVGPRLSEIDVIDDVIMGALRRETRCDERRERAGNENRQR